MALNVATKGNGKENEWQEYVLKTVPLSGTSRTPIPYKLLITKSQPAKKKRERKQKKGWNELIILMKWQHFPDYCTASIFPYSKWPYYVKKAQNLMDRTYS